jgi:hypothetical protein
MSEGTTYDVRIYRTEMYKGVKVTTYRIRWKVGNREWRQGFRSAAQADSFRSALLTPARRGEAFSLASGRPTVWEREKAEMTWYEFACRYVDMKWEQASAKYRKDIARLGQDRAKQAGPDCLPACRGTVTRPPRLGCLSWACEPFWTTTTQPSLPSARTSSRPVIRGSGGMEPTVNGPCDSQPGSWTARQAPDQRSAVPGSLMAWPVGGSPLSQRHSGPRRGPHRSQILARICRSEPHTAVPDRTEPHSRATSKAARSQCFTRS